MTSSEIKIRLWIFCPQMTLHDVPKMFQIGVKLGQLGLRFVFESEKASDPSFSDLGHFGQYRLTRYFGWFLSDCFITLKENSTIGACSIIPKSEYSSENGLNQRWHWSETRTRAFLLWSISKKVSISSRWWPGKYQKMLPIDTIRPTDKRVLLWRYSTTIWPMPMKWHNIHGIEFKRFHARPINDLFSRFEIWSFSFYFGDS